MIGCDSQRMQWPFNCIFYFLWVFEWNESEKFMGSKSVYLQRVLCQYPHEETKKCPMLEINGCPIFSSFSMVACRKCGKSVKQEISLKSQLHRTAHLKNDLNHRNGHMRHTQWYSHETPENNFQFYIAEATFFTSRSALCFHSHHFIFFV